MPELASAKGALAMFQNGEFASGAVAMPASPIPPALASGDILKKGTAIVPIFIGEFWAKDTDGNKKQAINKKIFSLKFILLRYWILNP